MARGRVNGHAATVVLELPELDLVVDALQLQAAVADPGLDPGTAGQAAALLAYLTAVRDRKNAPRARQAQARERKRKAGV